MILTANGFGIDAAPPIVEQPKVTIRFFITKKIKRE